MHPMLPDWKGSTVRRDIVWQSLPTPGIEHLAIRPDGDGVRFDGVVIDAGDPPFRVWYDVRADAAWRVRSCTIRLLAEPERKTALHADGEGIWTDTAGNTIEALHGCIDIDLTATPSTNALPIRRLALRPGQSADVLVAWVQFPDLTVTPSLQRYTCLEQTEDGELYRFLGVESGFTADLPIDAAGFVLDYADLWRRLR